MLPTLRNLITILLDSFSSIILYDKWLLIISTWSNLIHLFPYLFSIKVSLKNILHLENLLINNTKSKESMP